MAEAIQTKKVLKYEGKTPSAFFNRSTRAFVLVSYVWLMQEPQQTPVPM